jgi:alkylation response protein AidB-like acyl-CoA dehydrogenase
VTKEIRVDEHEKQLFRMVSHLLKTAALAWAAGQVGIAERLTAAAWRAVEGVEVVDFGAPLDRSER